MLKQHKSDWILLFTLGVILFFLYGANLRELFKRIVEWGFALTGFKLLIEYGIIKKVNEFVVKDEQKDEISHL